MHLLACKSLASVDILLEFSLEVRIVADVVQTEVVGGNPVAASILSLETDCGLALYIDKCQSVFASLIDSLLRTVGKNPCTCLGCRRVLLNVLGGSLQLVDTHFQSDNSLHSLSVANPVACRNPFLHICRPLLLGKRSVSLSHQSANRPSTRALFKTWVDNQSSLVYRVLL